MKDIQKFCFQSKKLITLYIINVKMYFANYLRSTFAFLYIIWIYCKSSNYLVLPVSNVSLKHITYFLVHFTTWYLKLYIKFLNILRDCKLPKKRKEHEFIQVCVNLLCVGFNANFNNSYPTGFSQPVLCSWIPYKYVSISPLIPHDFHKVIGEL